MVGTNEKCRRDCKCSDLTDVKRGKKCVKIHATATADLRSRSPCLEDNKVNAITSTTWILQHGGSLGTSSPAKYHKDDPGSQCMCQILDLHCRTTGLCSCGPVHAHFIEKCNRLAMSLHHMYSTAFSNPTTNQLECTGWCTGWQLMQNAHVPNQESQRS